MDEPTYKRISIKLQILGMVGALIAGGIALWQYTDASRKDFQSPVWAKQVELYEEATRTVARLAHAESPVQWREAKAKFWELYAGPLILVEDDKVEAGMVIFGGLLGQIGDNFEKRNTLEKPAIKLSQIFRASISSSIGSGLPALSSAEGN